MREKLMEKIEWYTMYKEEHSNQRYRRAIILYDKLCKNKFLNDRDISFINAL